MARTIDITAQEAIEEIADDTVSWIDSELFEALLRGACADASLLRELDDLAPDTIAEL